MGQLRPRAFLDRADHPDRAIPDQLPYGMRREATALLVSLDSTTMFVASTTATMNCPDAFTLDSRKGKTTGKVAVPEGESSGAGVLSWLRNRSPVSNCSIRRQIEVDPDAGGHRLTALFRTVKVPVTDAHPQDARVLEAHPSAGEIGQGARPRERGRAALVRIHPDAVRVAVARPTGKRRTGIGDRAQRDGLTHSGTTQHMSRRSRSHLDCWSRCPCRYRPWSRSGYG